MPACLVPPFSFNARRALAQYARQLMTRWQELKAAFGARIHEAGFDLLGAANVDAYNASLDEALGAYRLPSFERASALVLLVGNTRRLWPRFVHAYKTTSLGDEAHPLDAYSRMHIGSTAMHLAAEHAMRVHVRYSFDPAPNAIAIQRLAHVVGAAEIAPVGLCIHPVHGPWFSLRAAIVLDVGGPEASRAAPTCSACEARPCLAARARVEALVGERGFTRESFEEHWQAWLAMRDACPVGRSSRYGEQQIRYHYRKDLRVLREA